jgi:hypothetical protein
MPDSKNDIEVLVHIRRRASTPRENLPRIFRSSFEKIKNAIGGMRLISSRQGNRGSSEKQKEDRTGMPIIAAVYDRGYGEKFCA